MVDLSAPLLKKVEDIKKTGSLGWVKGKVILYYNIAPLRGVKFWCPWVIRWILMYVCNNRSNESASIFELNWTKWKLI